MQILALDVARVILAAAIFVAAVCSVDKMTRATSHSMRAAVVLVLAGALGEALAIAGPIAGQLLPVLSGRLSGWERWIDVLFFGGVAAWLFADRRGPFAPPSPESTHGEHHRAQLRMAAITRRLSVAISGGTLALVLAAWSGLVVAKPVMQLAMDEVVVMLHDEPCALAAVTGGQYHRARWIEKGVPVEGCWGLARIPGNTTVIFYFADRTIAAIPASAFTRVGEA